MNLSSSLRTGMAVSIMTAAASISHAQSLVNLPGGPLHAPGEVLVQFRSTVTQAEANEALRRAGLGLLQHIRTPAMADHGQFGLVRALTVLQGITVTGGTLDI